MELAGHRTSKLAEHRGWDRLVYNPITMWSYHRLAAGDAEQIAEALTKVFPDCARYADIGAGSGAHAAALHRRGIQVVGYERSHAGRLFGRLQGASMRGFDLSGCGISAPEVDLAYCFEVGEHLPPTLADSLVDFLHRLAPLVVFSAAQPGQGGYGHINERPPSYWEAKFRSHGCVAWLEAKEALLLAFAETGVEATWYYDNLNVFRRSPRASQ